MKFETVEYLKNPANFKNGVELSDQQIKELQNELLDILRDFNSACKRNGLSFFLSGGTALGAIRHRGFIPWDDDIDLNIVRKDVPKLLDVYKKELYSKYYLHTPETNPELGLGFIRLRKKGTILKAREDYFNQECGIFIDIFIVENTYDKKVFRTVQGFLSYLTGFLLSCRNFYKNRTIYHSLLQNNAVFSIKICVGFFLSILPVRFYTLQWNKANKMCHNNNSYYVAIPCGRKHFFGELYERERLVNTTEAEFEDLKLPISMDYNYYLSKLYGDYKTIPKEKEKHIILEYKRNLTD